jgi:hypothetical protein
VRSRARHDSNRGLSIARRDAAAIACAARHDAWLWEDIHVQRGSSGGSPRNGRIRMHSSPWQVPTGNAHVLAGTYHGSVAARQQQIAAHARLEPCDVMETRPLGTCTWPCDAVRGGEHAPGGSLRPPYRWCGFSLRDQAPGQHSRGISTTRSRGGQPMRIRSPRACTRLGNAVARK